MGTGNIDYAAKTGGVEITGVCDVYQPALERAQAQARRLGFTSVKTYKDFREILADKSIDAVSIATPDHWHAYITVEACKAGKDVWCEKPACVYVEEGVKMVEAARKYQRVVQAGTMQRSGALFPEGPRNREERRPGRHHLLQHLSGRHHRARKASAIRRIPTRRRASIGTCGSAPRPSARSTPTAGAWRPTAGPPSAISGTTPAAP